MLMNKPKREHDFQSFYFRKVATGEGCGCAERIIDVHEFNRTAGLRRRVLPRMSLTRFLQKAGLYRRK